jgi:anti-sigma B factor antagonist
LFLPGILFDQSLIIRASAQGRKFGVSFDIRCGLPFLHGGFQLRHRFRWPIRDCFQRCTLIIKSELRLEQTCKTAHGRYNPGDLEPTEGVVMATNPVPVSELGLTTDSTPTEIIVHCTGKISSNTIQSLKATVKPLFSESKTVTLDLTNVSYMDSSGLGAIVGLYVSAKTAKSQLKLINLNQQLKELFSITRLGQFLAEGRNPNDLGLP